MLKQWNRLVKAKGIQAAKQRAPIIPMSMTISQ